MIRIRHTGGARGFSLAEVLVTLAIIAFVLQIAASLVLSANRQMAFTSRLSQDQTQMIAARTQLRALISNLVWTQTSSGGPQAFLEAERTGARWRTATRAGIAAVALKLQASAEDGPFHLVIDRGQGPARPLLTAVKTLSLRYYGPVNGAPARWYATWPDGTRAPRLV